MPGSSEWDDKFASCAPNSAPGGVFVRIVSEDGEVLTEHPLLQSDDFEALAGSDADVTNEALARGITVFNYAYDGDSGECMATVVVEPE